MARARNIQSRSHVCRYCGTQLSTMQGLRSHYKQSVNCQKARTRSMQEMEEKETHRQRRVVAWIRDKQLQRPDPSEELNIVNDVDMRYDFNEQNTHSNEELGDNELKQDPPREVTVKEPVVTVKFPRSCAVKYGVCETRWEIMIEATGEKQQWGGFADEEEWELARWLIKSNASQKDIDNFAKLAIVSKRRGNVYVPSFHFTALTTYPLDEKP